MILKALGFEIRWGERDAPSPQHPAPSLPARSRLDPLDIIQGLDEGLLTVDSDRRVLLANEALAPLLNRPPADTVGRPLWEVLRHREVNDMAERALTAGTPDTRDVSFPSTEENTWRVHARPLAQGAVLTFLDLTQIRRLESVRKDFVANVSHELKTPLTSLRAALETLLDGALEDPAYAKEFLQTAQDQVERLQRLIEDLLALSLLEKEEGMVPPARAQVQTVAKRVAAALEPLARKAAVSLVADLPAAPLDLPLDEDRLTQLLMNLMDNAVKFNRPGGKVTLAAWAEDGQAVITVSDTGVGIPPQDQSRVFERFYRVDKSRGADAGGTGLGLSIAKHIVEKRGGTIRLDSVLGEGSTFTVTLPLP